MKKPLLLGGPSGAGKSTLCRHLQANGWCYLEADWEPPTDGIDALDLRREWDAFWKDHDATELAASLTVRGAKCAGVVLSLPSRAVPSLANITRNLSLLDIRFLWGDPRWCFHAFVRRESTTGRNLPASHWDANNTEVFSSLYQSGYHRYLVDAFSADGTHLPVEEIAQNL